MSFIVICLLSLDVMLIFVSLYDELAWLRTLRKRLQKEGRELELVKRDGELVLVSLSQQKREEEEREAWKRVKVEGEHEDGNTKSQQEVELEVAKQKYEEANKNSEKIDYPKTYRHMRYMDGLAMFLSAPLDLTPKVFGSSQPRYHLLVHLLRVSAYQLLVVSC